MGQWGVRSKSGVQIIKNPRRSQVQLRLQPCDSKNARQCSIFVSPTFVLKNENLQHESYRA